VRSGKRAYDTVFSQNLPVGPTARTDNSTPAFGRFCSSTLAGPDEGLDRYFYFANEEADSGLVRGVPSTFDGRGGLTEAGSKVWYEKRAMGAFRIKVPRAAPR